VVVAARTAPNRSVRFGGERGVLDRRGLRDAAVLASVLDDTGKLTVGPEVSAVQTASAIRPSFVVDSALTSLDVGGWQGLGPEAVPQVDLGAWFTDPDWTGHGGESVTAFVARIRGATAAIDAEVLVVAGPVAQALLCGAPDNFFSTEVRPASVHIAAL